MQIKEFKEKTNTALLDNIAQLPTRAMDEGSMKTLTKKARAKYYTQKINGPLCYIDSKLNKGYSRAYHCCDQLTQRKNKITAKYCNSRTCNVCNRIRTAKMINGYLNPLKELAESEDLSSLDFVTLTMVNCKEHELNDVVNKMLKDATNCIRVIREKKKIKVSGIRKLEITYNHIEDTYHPHFHFLINKESGNLLIEEWLKRNETAKHWCQKNQQANIGALAEIFKYTTKFLIKSDKNTFNVYVNPLDKIMIALYKKRTMQPFGIIKRIDENIDSEELISQEIIDIIDIENGEEIFIKEWYWQEEFNDWYSDITPLTNYKPPDINFKIFI